MDLDRHRVRVALDVSAEVIADRILATVTVADEVGWLIELADKQGVPSYHQLEYDDDWTSDANKALRFARREDAQAYIDHIGWTEPKPVEHMWPAASLQESGAQHE